MWLLPSGSLRCCSWQRYVGNCLTRGCHAVDSIVLPQCPFPSAEVFRCLPVRTSLLEGVLGADLIVFHSYEYLRHFLSASAQVLGVRCTLRCIEYNGRLVSTSVRPIGIGT